ncbi:MAG: Uma2 family endonuclease [Thermosynechococcaceae cyanobacterium MS004]|nr:Uma2 family endonuclease [Thermosynechococcaceae cyanobacterium MS004]
MTLFAELSLDELYPESDGNPVADNTEQFSWIVLIKENLEILFADRPDVFVAGDLLWYPVQSQLIAPTAPDALVAFGRPKGKRGSYRQWLEDNIAPQVVFEIVSPCNTKAEMQRKLEFYERYGVEEFYLFDPDRLELEGWVRRENGLDRITSLDGWVSPRLGVKFSFDGQEFLLFRPDGQRFLSPIELSQVAAQERSRADLEQQRADFEQQRANLAQQRAEAFAAKLRELGINPDEVG